VAFSSGVIELLNYDFKAQIYDENLAQNARFYYEEFVGTIQACRKLASGVNIPSIMNNENSYQVLKIKYFQVQS
jgi:hypothetical protein